MHAQTKAHALVAHLSGLDDFAIVDAIDAEYGHMGAIIIDAILQAGINYDKVVRPRVQRLLEAYPDAVTTSAFRELAQHQDLKAILLWKDDEKPSRVLALTEFLIEQGIETQQELAAWLTDDTNIPKLLAVRGVGPKTADYLKILAGLQTSAVDRYLFRILAEAGVQVADYSEARDVINLAADAMAVERAYLDHSIWRYMSGRDAGARRSTP